MVDDFLARERILGAKRVLLSSASSRPPTALRISCTRGAIRTIGLTSAGNVDFVNSLGCYDES